MYNWTAVDGVDPRPYAAAILYYCPRDYWAYPTSGLSQVMVYCQRDGTWSNTVNIELCQSNSLVLNLMKTSIYRTDVFGRATCKLRRRGL